MGGGGGGGGGGWVGLMIKQHAALAAMAIKRSNN